MRGAEPDAAVAGASAAEALASIPLFAGLTAVELARLVPELEEREFRPGEALFHQGDAADGLYLLRSGVASVSVEAEGGAQVVAVLEAPAYVGEMALLSDEPRSASVVAASAVSAWKLPRNRFDVLVGEHPRLPLQLAAEVTRRLAETTRRLSASQREVVALARSTLENLDEPARRLLRRASLFTVFDQRVMRDLLADEWDPEVFQSIRDHCPLVRPADGEGGLTFSEGWVREYLTEELQREVGEAGLAALRRRGARTAIRLGGACLRDALDLLLSAGDWPALTSLLREHGAALAEESADLVERCARALPDDRLWRDPTLVHLVARCRVLRGELEAAVEAYRRAEQYDPAARSGPTGAAYQSALADLYERMGRHTQALACLRRAMELGGRGVGFVVQAGEAGVPVDLPAFAEAAAHGDRGRLTLAGVRALAAASAASASRRGLITRWLVVAAIISLTAFAWMAPPPPGLPAEGVRVLSSIVASLAIGFLSVMPDFLVGLLMVTAWMVSGTLPASVAAAGFSSSTWFLLLSSMALGTAVARCGILYRGALEIVRRLPPSHTIRCLTLATLGVIFSPGMPNVLGRVSLAVPLAQDIAESLRYPPRSGGSAGLTLATYVGFGLLGTLFLTGTALSLIVYGLFPPEVQAEMGWGRWFIAALPAHVLIFGLMMAFILWRYRPEGADEVKAETIAVQRQVLGRLSRDEWSVLVVTLLLVAGFCTQSIHRFDPAWLSVIAIGVLFLTGALDESTFRGGVNVGFLLYLGVILGLGEIFNYLHLDIWLGQNLAVLVSLTGGSPTLFVLAVGLVSASLALLLRPGPISVLLGLALYPTASSMGINPWVVAMTILLSSSLWLYPQQSLIYLTAYYGTGERGFSHAQAWPLSLAHAVLIFLAILVSIPYWRWLGLIA